MREQSRKEIRESGGRDQGHGQGAFGEADGGGTGHGSGGPSHQGQRVLHPGPFNPPRPHRRPESSSGPGRKFPAGDPPRAKKGFVGAFRGNPLPLRCRGEHPGHLPVPGGGLRDLLLPPEHLPPDPGGGGRGESPAGTTAEPGILRHLSG